MNLLHGAALVVALCITIDPNLPAQRVFLGNSLPTISRITLQSTVKVSVPANENRKYGSLGAGAIVHASGYILTCEHVVRGQKMTTIKLAPGTEPLPAAVVWVSATRDLALLKLLIVPKGLKALTLASSNPQIGESLLAVGHPRGLTWTVSQGIVSRYDSKVHIRTEDTLFIQTTTSVNPGNSGGPLVNDKAELVGIVSMSEVERLYNNRPVPVGINYAVSVVEIREFLNEAFAGLDQDIKL